MVPDEYIGLAGGLLQAGAACAVVSLWPVDDEATALLMTRFYELLDANSVGPPQTQKPQTALHALGRQRCLAAVSEIRCGRGSGFTFVTTPPGLERTPIASTARKSYPTPPPESLRHKEFLPVTTARPRRRAGGLCNGLGRCSVSALELVQREWS